MRLLLVQSISGYQKYISPHKGFCCAYGVATGRWTCSSYGKKIARRHGVVAFARGMMRQFARCKAAHLALKAALMAQAADVVQDDEEARRRVIDKQKSRSVWDSCNGGPSCPNPGNFDLGCVDLSVIDVSCLDVSCCSF